MTALPAFPWDSPMTRLPTSPFRGFWLDCYCEELLEEVASYLTGMSSPAVMNSLTPSAKEVRGS